MKNVAEGSLMSRVFSLPGVDTAFILFFLGMEYGRSVRALSADGLMMSITMVMVIVLPYFLPSGLRCQSLASWLLARTAVTAAGLAMGAVFAGSLAPQLPASARLMPMTGLVIASMISCYVQFYGLMRLRLAK
jgi:hypothetical protein